jgi:hypothetical protein
MDDEDKRLEAIVRKYMRRSGIRRLYCYPNGLKTAPGYLELEFVVWGHVFFRVRLWKIKSFIKE